MQTQEWAQKMPKLGFGLMRLPGTQGGGEADIPTVTKMVDAFMDAGLED
jgi:predicted aldo/keto reductase-like oxidoreductase